LPSPARPAHVLVAAKIGSQEKKKRMGRKKNFLPEEIKRIVDCVEMNIVKVFIVKNRKIAEETTIGKAYYWYLRNIPVEYMS
jgi:hypothetical protein